MTEKVLFSWSGGKDSALALREIIESGGYEISALLTTVTEDYERVSMHGVRQALLRRQAEVLGFPLEEVFISRSDSNEDYDSKIQAVLTGYLASGVSSVVFGDVFLADIRAYREENLAKIGMEAVFPLWKRDTGRLAREFIGAGFRAVITCVDSNALDRRFAGAALDEEFLGRLPNCVDPGGENGEYHSFVYDGPIFREEISFTPGEVVLRDGRFYFCDLIPCEGK